MVNRGGEMRQSMKVLTSSTSDEWGTPGFIIGMSSSVMGTIEIDPAASSNPNQWFASVNIVYAEDGLTRFWRGTTFLNPPYSNMPKWADKICEQWGRNYMPEGIALFKCYVGYKWFERVMDSCSAVCFLRDRLTFIPLDGQEIVSDGRAKFGSCVFYWGKNTNKFEEVFSKIGWVRTSI